MLTRDLALSFMSGGGEAIDFASVGMLHKTGPTKLGGKWSVASGEKRGINWEKRFYAKLTTASLRGLIAPGILGLQAFWAFY